MSNPDRIYLEPDTGDPDNRTWSEDAIWPLPGSGDDREGVEYIRADLVADGKEKVFALSGPGELCRACGWWRTIPPGPPEAA